MYDSQTCLLKEWFWCSLKDLFPPQEPDSRLWPYVYPNKYPAEEERWREERERDRDRERDRKGKEERPRPKEEQQREESGEGPRAPEDPRGGGKDPRPLHMHFSPQQHQAYLPYMQGAYGYGQGFDPNTPGYRAVPSVMIHNYPGEPARPPVDPPTRPPVDPL